MELTKEQISEYIDDGCCPKCGSQLGISCDTHYYPTSVFVSYKCPSCNAITTEGYELVSVEVSD